MIGLANYPLGNEGKDTARSYLNKAKKVHKDTKCQDPELIKHIEELLESLGAGRKILIPFVIFLHFLTDNGERGG